MKIRELNPIHFLAACAVLAAIPAAAHAAKVSAMDTCIQTFVADQLPQDREIEIVKSDLTRGAPGPGRITVSAKGKRSGKPIASATCVIDRDGGLMAMYVQGERIRLAQSDEPRARTGG